MHPMSADVKKKRIKMVFGNNDGKEKANDCLFLQQPKKLNLEHHNFTLAESLIYFSLVQRQHFSCSLCLISFLLLHCTVILMNV